MFFELEEILFTSTPHKKIDHFNHFYKKYQKKATFDHNSPIKPLTKPSYSSFCKIVPPKAVPKRVRLGSTQGRAIFLHAIAHIEYSAIDLALDAAYRFRHMPKDFYNDWLEVAADECRHFLIIEELLNELGFCYGDFPVHTALFDAALKTQHSLLERMAVVPRYFEANGLDANPRMIKRLEGFCDDFSQKIIEVLKTILAEEVAHVQKGDRWFRYAAKKEGMQNLEEVYFAILKKHYPGSEHSKPWLNVEARKKAGFSCSEIKRLSREEVECG